MSGKEVRKAPPEEMHGDFRTEEGGELCAMPPASVNELPGEVETPSDTPTLDAQEDRPKRSKKKVDTRPKYDDLPREEKLRLAQEFNPSKERELELAVAQGYDAGERREVEVLRANATAPYYSEEERAAFAKQADELEARCKADEAEAQRALNEYLEAKQRSHDEYQ